MRRIRSVKPEWLEDERLAMASPEARVLSIALMLLADDGGRFRANRVMLAGQVFPAAPELLARALDELELLRFVVLYEVDGQHYGEIRNWEKHQKIDKPTQSKLPANTVTSDSVANPRESSRAISEPSASPRASRASTPIHSYPDPEGVQGEPSGPSDPWGLEPPSARPDVTAADTTTGNRSAGQSRSSVVRRVFEAWKADTGHARATLDGKRAKRIEARLREGFTEQDLVDAIAGRHRDDWLMGRDPRSPRVFDEIDTLFRDAAQVEKLRDLALAARSGSPEARADAPPDPVVMAAIEADRAKMRAESEELARKRGDLPAEPTLDFSAMAAAKRASVRRTAS